MTGGSRLPASDQFVRMAMKVGRVPPGFYGATWSRLLTPGAPCSNLRSGPVRQVDLPAVTPRGRWVMLIDALLDVGARRGWAAAGVLVEETLRFVQGRSAGFVALLSRLRTLLCDRVRPTALARRRWRPGARQRFMWTLMGRPFSLLLAHIETEGGACYGVVNELAPLFSSIPGFREWREAFSFPELVDLIEESYARVEVLIGGAPRSVASLFSLWQADVASALTPWCAMERLANRDQPALLIRPGDPLVDGHVPARVAPPGLALRCLRWVLDRVRRRSAQGRSVGTPRGACYVVIEDNGNGANLRAGLPLVEALREAGESPVILTRCPSVEAAAALHGVPVLLFRAPVAPYTAVAWARRFRRFLRLAAHALRLPPASAERQAVGTLLGWLTVFWEWTIEIKKSLRQAFSMTPPRAVFAIGESHTLSRLAGTVGRRWNAPWIGWNHLLLMDTRDNRVFPADHHLFYGDQGLEIFAHSGGDMTRAAAVGSPAYDSAVGRDFEKDRRYVQELLSRWNGTDRLVVVGTENRHGQEAELLPTLACLAGMAGVHTVLKLHPDDEREAFAAALGRLDPDESRISVVGPCDLVALLNGADLLVTQYSNILITAALLNTPVLVFDFRGARPVDFVGEGIADGVFAEGDLDGAIRALLYDDDAKERRLRTTAENLRRFNTSNDGRAAHRVVDYYRGLGRAVAKVQNG